MKGNGCSFHETTLVFGSRLRWSLIKEANDFAGLRPKRFPCYSSSFVMRLLLHICCFCCPNMFLISSSFGASGGLCFVIVALPGSLHL